MSSPLSILRQRDTLEAIARACRERGRLEAEIAETFPARDSEAATQYETIRATLEQRFKDQKDELAQNLANARREIEEHCQKQEYERRSTLDASILRIRKESERKMAAAKTSRREAVWEATTVFEATCEGPKLRLDETVQRANGFRQELLQISQQAEQSLQQRHLWRDGPGPFSSGDETAETVGTTPDECKHAALEELSNLQSDRFTRLFQGARPYLLAALLGAVVAVAAGFAFHWQGWNWLASGGCCFAALLAVEWLWAYPKARRRGLTIYREVQTHLAAAEAAVMNLLQEAERECQKQFDAIVVRRDGDLKSAEESFVAVTSAVQTQLDAETTRDTTACEQHLTSLTEARNAGLQELRAKHDRLQQQLAERYADQTNGNFERYTEATLASRAEREGIVRRMSEEWGQAVQNLNQAIRGASESSDGCFPAWDAVDWRQWNPPISTPRGIRFGSFPVDLAMFPGGLPADPQLATVQARFELPAMLTLPESGSLVIEARGTGRAAAVVTMQNVMLRMLTSFPPGKAQFTILDPTGLGENFSSFMHLADYDPRLVTHRIWTEPKHLEQRLADLTEHMENVIQKYLRNEYASIDEYNARAGEIAEPYRIVVAANFPAGFNEAATRRLLSIAEKGPRCGVHILASIDTQLPTPPGVDVSDLATNALTLKAEDHRVVPADQRLAAFPFQAEVPPSAERVSEILHAVGARAKEAGKVELPFAAIAPAPERRWTESTSAEIAIPIGRAGASNIRALLLGQGTSQHVLLAGKTGSGKSNLLHALITSAALRYAPSEVEFYLVDFKKGVEFQAYAKHRLPHARVIAIESEREFGLSVLERLDEELKSRGDRYRAAGVQDLTAWRRDNPKERMPRLLLVVDEFQELFVEDDKLAQDAALYLDRMVRQGRAFGIHVLLASQTLAGAFSLARSTMGQMAVRIALQCSESDAHLILSDENGAARLLSRPGEAIYNDANGRIEGNHPFQTVFLPDQQRDAALSELAELARVRNVRSFPIVFEGNRPADLAENAQLASLLGETSWPAAPAELALWLGAAISIKDPTSALLARRSGCNLLLVGQRPQEAAGVLASCAIGFAAQTTPADETERPRLICFDGAAPDAPVDDVWQRIASALPHRTQIVRPRDAAAAIAELAEELARRRAAPDAVHPPVLVLVYHLGRFRDLEKPADDYSFGSAAKDSPVKPGKLLGELLREGPGLAMHVAAWCDNYATVSRYFDRAALREIEQRVLFQMSATDSTHLIDSPMASQLGVHRAVYYDEGRGVAEKFRPYGLPTEDWLARVKASFGVRAVVR